MAAMDDNPNVKEGQSWSSWADIVGFKNSGNEEEEEDTAKEKNWKKRRENDAMKLRKEEMGLFGYCPTWDDFFLVVCELCGRVVKPQAFSGHLEYRHGTSSHSNRESAASNPQSHHHHGKNSGSGGSVGGGSSGTSGPNAPSLSTNRSGNSSTLPLLPNRSSTTSSGSLYSNQVVFGGVKSSSYISNYQMNKPNLFANNSFDVNNTPETLVSNSGCINNGKASKVDSKSKKNHSIDPVVRVERMPNSVVMKKTVTGSSSPNEIDIKQEHTLSPSVMSISSPSAYVPLSHNLNYEIEYVQNSPSDNVLYEGTSGPGPGGSNFTSNLLESSIPALIANTNSHRKIATSPKAVNEVLKRTMTISGESHLIIPPSNPNKKPNKCKKSSKERKLVLCKDREYDANKHCGVFVAESGKPCTRSLTCKTHSLSLRRAVKGRKKNFDELLSEHRAAKEAQLKPSSQTNVSSNGCSNSQGCNFNTDGHGSSRVVPGSTKLNHIQTIASLHKVVSLGRVSKINAGGSSKVVHQSSSSSTSTNVLSISNHSLQRISVSGNKAVPDLSLDGASFFDLDSGKPTNLESPSKNHSVHNKDLPYVTYHPRPAAMCSFGVRRMGSGVFLPNRLLDSTRSALEMAFLHEKGTRVPQKKLCVESGLLPLREPLETSDPYNFMCLDLSGVNESNDSESSIAASSSFTKLKNHKSSNSVGGASLKGSQNLSNNISSGSAITVTPNAPLLVSHTIVKNLTSTKTPVETVTACNSSAVKRTTKSKLVNAVNKLKRLKSSSVEHSNSVTSTNKSPSTSATKKRRTSNGTIGHGNSNPSISSVPSMSNSQSSGVSQTVTLTALNPSSLCSTGNTTVQTARSLPLSFPLIGERLGALSRLQVSGPFVNRNSVNIAPAVLRNPGSTLVNSSVLASGVPNHVTSNSLKDSVFLTGVDVINGQLPVTTTLLHSVTVSRASDVLPTTLLATPSTGGLGITLSGHSTTGLVNQLRLQQNITSISNKPTDSVVSGLSGAKGTKCKTRKTSSKLNSGSTSVQSISNRTFSSPLNLGLSLLLDGSPGAFSSAQVTSSSGKQISSGSSPTSCQSPQLKMDSLSPGVSSPIVNGKGPSSPHNLPPLFTPKSVFGSSGTTVTSSTISGTSVRLSPASRTNTPSPDCLSSTSFPLNATKGKTKHSTSYSKSVTALNAAVAAAAAAQHGNLAFPVTSVNLSTLPVGTTNSAQPITYQQVFASQMLTQAQLNQLQFHSPTTVPTKNKNVNKGNSVAATQQLSLNSSALPLKLPLLTSSGIATAASLGQQHRHLLLSDDSRRKDLQQDSHSLST